MRTLVSETSLARRYKELVDLPAAAKVLEKRDGGREFERLLHATLAAEGLHPRTNYRPDGEEGGGGRRVDIPTKRTFVAKPGLRWPPAGPTAFSLG